MRERLIVSAALLTLTSIAMALSAKAFDNSNNNAGATHSAQPTPGWTSLECKPPLARSDSDPVINSNVAINLQNDGTPTEINVTHHLFSGRSISRGDQYSNEGVKKKSGFNEWFWTGVLLHNPRISMRGKIYLTSHGDWFYEEHIFRDGGPDKVIYETCQEAQGD
jgi:hypothetical protein